MNLATVRKLCSHCRELCFLVPLKHRCSSNGTLMVRPIVLSLESVFSIFFIFHLIFFYCNVAAFRLATMQGGQDVKKNSTRLETTWVNVNGPFLHSRRKPEPVYALADSFRYALYRASLSGLRWTGSATDAARVHAASSVCAFTQRSIERDSVVTILSALEVAFSHNSRLRAVMKELRMHRWCVIK